MGHARRPAAWRPWLSTIGTLGWLVVLVGTARCTDSGPAQAPSSATLRVGFGGLPQQSAQGGLQQFASNFSLEGLVNLTEDGRPRAWLAEGWSMSEDRLTLTIRLRPNATFHDGSPVTATVVADTLRVALPKNMGAVFEDVDTINASSPNTIEIKLKRPSPFVLESLEALIRKPGSDANGTGPFAAIKGKTPGLRGFGAYYLGAAPIQQITETPYPSVRTAWAELLRGNLDMLYEVNLDALDSLEGSTNVAVFSYLRHYQYMIAFGSQAPALQSPSVRRELNAAIDRGAVVRAAMNGHGVPSAGPVPPQHWALDKSSPKLAFNSALAKSLAARHLKFTCLVPADSVYERVALAVKQQLAAASVDMQVQEATQDEVVKAATNNSFEAILGDIISGPSIFRSYRHWYSTAPAIPKPIGSPLIDAALDRIRHAASDDEYRAGVTAFQQAIVDDPPALFLAWGERARAVSRRFDVPAPEAGRDVLATLRLWRPVGAPRVASTN